MGHSKPVSVMEAMPELIQAHLTTHNAHPGGVVLGYFPVAVPENITDLFEISVKLWWDKGFQARSQPSHRFTFWDFCTGNVSLPRQLFNDLGGFDERFHGKAGEDYEFGITNFTWIHPQGYALPGRFHLKIKQAFNYHKT